MTYNASQSAAIACPAAITICTAVPGAGKTRTIIGRVLHGPCDPARTSVITFTTAAAAVIQSRLKEHGVTVAAASTIHSFFYRLLVRYHDLIGMGSRIGIADEETADAILKETASEQRYKGTMADLQKVIEGGPVPNPSSSAQLCAAGYWRKLSASNMVDFASILRLGGKLLEHPKVIGEWLFDDVLYDEAQDATDAYVDLVMRMPCKRLFIAADFNQAIFGFLGENSHRLEAMMKTALHRG